MAFLAFSKDDFASVVRLSAWSSPTTFFMEFSRLSKLVAFSNKPWIFYWPPLIYPENFYDPSERTFYLIQTGIFSNKGKDGLYFWRSPLIFVFCSSTILSKFPSCYLNLASFCNLISLNFCITLLNPNNSASVLFCELAAV